MKFCPDCGSAVVRKTPAGDNRERDCCDACGAIHYRNPNMVLGTVPVLGGRVLLCRRAIEPRYGYWTLPAGFMENGETAAEGALRETHEEAGIEVALGALFSLISVPHVDQVHAFYLADMISDRIEPGEETLEARLFDESEIPWEQIAFRTVETTLRWYFEDRARGRFDMHTGDIHFNRPRPKPST
ncbi:MAG: NUDIX hydrolase [Burkholderiaceae bacterium]